MDYPTPMMVGACLVSTEATFVEEDESERDEHVLGIKFMGIVFMDDDDDMPVGAESRAMYPKEFIRNLRDALSEWLNDGGHFHVTDDGFSREPEHADLPSEEDEERNGDGQVSE